MTGLASIAPKLAKLIPLLSSDHAGEVVATAAARGRLLKGAGLSWHDVADAVVPVPPPVSVTWQASPRPPHRSTTPKGSTRKEQRFSFAHLMPREANRELALLLARIGLSDNERAFLQAVQRQLYTAPHQFLEGSVIRRLNRIWRREFEPKTDRGAA